MSIRLSSWRTALRALSSIRSQSKPSVPLASTRRCVDRLIEARLQTEMFSASCGRQISVQRFDRWIVPVLLLRARLLIVSFQVSHGWLVVWREIRIDLNCSRAPIFWNMRSSPASAIATYSA